MCLYIQQYLRKGSPRHLDEQDRQILAQFFGVDEAVLGGPVARHTPIIELVQIPVLDVEASAGHGAVAGAESQAGQFGFDENGCASSRRRGLPTSRSSRSLANSMEPTLHDGDEVLVDVSDEQSKLRDGIYVLRMDGALNVKRVAIEPQGRKISVVSDNAAYPSWQGLDRRSINIVGRVLWFGRKV